MNNDIRKHIDLITERASTRQWDDIHKWQTVPLEVRERLQNTFGLDELCNLLTDGNGEKMTVRHADLSNSIVFSMNSNGPIKAILRNYEYRYDVMKLEDLTIKPEQSRKGIGTRILKNTVDACRKLGIGRLELTAADSGLIVWLKAGFLLDKGETKNLIDKIESDRPVYDDEKDLSDGIFGYDILNGNHNYLIDALKEIEAEPTKVWWYAENCGDFREFISDFADYWNGYFDPDNQA